MTKEARGALVLEHVASENRHESGGTLKDFGHPPYEIVAPGQVFDGPAEVAGGMLALLLFEEQQLVGGRVCFDTATTLAQLGLAPSLPVPIPA